MGALKYSKAAHKVCFPDGGFLLALDAFKRLYVQRGDNPFVSHQKEPGHSLRGIRHRAQSREEDPAADPNIGAARNGNARSWVREPIPYPGSGTLISSRYS